MRYECLETKGHSTMKANHFGGHSYQSAVHIGIHIPSCYHDDNAMSIKHLIVKISEYSYLFGCVIVMLQKVMASCTGSGSTVETFITLQRHCGGVVAVFLCYQDLGGKNYENLAKNIIQ